MSVFYFPFHVLHSYDCGLFVYSDMESAQGILSVMAQAGLELGADTYTTLLCGYARTGDIDTINKTLQECEAKEIYFLDKDYLDIAYSLIANGHEQHVPVVLEKLRKAFGYNQVSGSRC